MNANGTMVKRTQGIGAAQTWTVYVGGIYEVTNTGAVTKYYQAFGAERGIELPPVAAQA